MHSIPHDMIRHSAFALALALAGMSPVLADTSATVTESVNDVSHGSAQASATQPAPVGTHLADGDYLKTGTKSRAELQLATQGITRLGANTVFNYSAATNEVDLQAGTILFSKPKDGKEMIIKTTSVTAAIVGTSGFAQMHDKTILFGLIEGHANVKTADGHPYTIGAGQILRLAPDGKPQVFFYNIPLFLSTSPLLNKFHSKLPNQAYIDAEVAKYKDFVARGFIAPLTQPIYLSDIESSVPVIPVAARDSAANSLNDFNDRPPPQSQPQSNPFGFGP